MRCGAIPGTRSALATSRPRRGAGPGLCQHQVRRCAHSVRSRVGVGPDCIAIRCCRSPERVGLRLSRDAPANGTRRDRPTRSVLGVPADRPSRGLRQEQGRSRCAEASAVHRLGSTVTPSPSCSMDRALRPSAEASSRARRARASARGGSRGMLEPSHLKRSRARDRRRLCRPGGRPPGSRQRGR